MPRASVQPTVPSSSRPKGSAYRLLDACRGFAALWVVMVHACLATIVNTSPQLAHVPLYAFSLWGQLGVTIFFVISGYCITAAAFNILKTGKPYSQFAIARLRRIYPPYFASLVCIALMACLATLLAKVHLLPPMNHPIPFWGQSPLFYFSHLTLTQLPFNIEPISPIYWSLCYEIAFYLVVFCFLLASNRSVQRLSFFLIATTLVAIGAIILTHGHCPFPFNLWPQFGFGALVYLQLTNREQLWPKISFAVATLLFAACAILEPGTRMMGHPAPADQIILCLCFCVLLLALYRFDDLIHKFKPVLWFSWLGNISYSLYLSHFLVLAIIVQLTNKLHLTDGKYWVSYFLQVIIAVGCSYFFFLLFEKPFLKSKSQFAWNLPRLNQASKPETPQEYAAEKLAAEQSTS